MSGIDDINFTMEDIVEDVTNQTIKYINSTPALYKNVKENLKYNMSIQDTCVQWAVDHNNEFGELFQTELDMVDWDKVKERV